MRPHARLHLMIGAIASLAAITAHAQTPAQVTLKRARSRSDAVDRQRRLGRFDGHTAASDHLRENYDSNGVPSFNTNRAETLASFDRFKKIAANLKATVIIQHDPRDVEKLPAFPAAAN